MKLSIPFTTLYFLLLIFLNFSCQAQEQSSESKKQEVKNSQANTAEQLGKYVVELFEDSKGNLWIGTLSKGVAKYDGNSLTYFSVEEGLPNQGVVSILEDKEGNIWFGTQNSLSKFDGKTFTNFGSNEGLGNTIISKLFMDSKGQFWVGTWGGVYLFDGEKFSKFALPVPDILPPYYQETMNWVTQIMEDSKGNIWIGRSGYGACKYDGKNFIHFTKEDGLPSNCVQEIEEDHAGNIWFGTRVAEKDHPDPMSRKGDGGISKYDGESMLQFPGIEGLSKNDNYLIYKDKKGKLWIGANGVGLYHYDGIAFVKYDETDRMDLSSGFGVQAALEDNKGNYWFGFSGGLYRLIDDSLINVTQGGPWE